MWSRHLLLGLAGAVTGGATAAGTFAFVIIIGVIPRLIGKLGRAVEKMRVGTTIIIGGFVGAILSLYPELRIPLGSPLLMVYGLCAGIFVGCISVALAEILNTFPILFRRLKIKEGLFWVMLAIALGKMAGAFYFFLADMTAK